MSRPPATTYPRPPSPRRTRPTCVCRDRPAATHTLVAPCRDANPAATTAPPPPLVVPSDRDRAPFEVGHQVFKDNLESIEMDLEVLRTTLIGTNGAKKEAEESIRRLRARRES
ncbi:hypothetical protein ACSQ67_016999 [Phaseolus vulgaris]